MTEKILINRNVKFDEFSKWNWEKCEVEASNKGKLGEDNLQEQNFEDEEEYYDSDTEILVKGTRTLEELYEWCNVAALEPTSYAEAAIKEGWRVAMQELVKMIEKNRTW